MGFSPDMTLISHGPAHFHPSHTLNMKIKFKQWLTFSYNQFVYNLPSAKVFQFQALEDRFCKLTENK